MVPIELFRAVSPLMDHWLDGGAAAKSTKPNPSDSEPEFKIVVWERCLQKY